MQNKFLYIFFSILIVIFTFNLVISKKNNCSDNIYYFDSASDNEPSIEQVVDKAHNCLFEQRAVFTIPQINKHLINRVLGIKVNDFFGYIAQKSYSLYLKFFYNNNHYPYGGIILYDYNFSGKFKTDYSLINNLKEKKTRKLTFYNPKFKSSYQVEVEPYIFSDCVPFNVPHVYCRGVDIDKNNQSNIAINKNYRDIANTYLKYIKFYGDLGIDSALGPVVDLDKSSNEQEFIAMTNYAQTVSSLMYSEGFIPTLKHFSYDQTIGDSHVKFTVNNISKSNLLKILMPYTKVDELEIPYMIMTTHQAISSLDEINPATQSRVVYDYIKNEYPNSIVIADSISMEGMLGKNYYEKLIRGQADNFIIHLGIYFPMINMYHSRKALNEMIYNKEAIYRVLKNKHMYNKLKFKKL